MEGTVRVIFEHAAFIARIEGLNAETRTAFDDFHREAASYIRDHEHETRRRHPQFYSNREREEAGVPDDWADRRLWPQESAEWAEYIKHRRVVCGLPDLRETSG